MSQTPPSDLELMQIHADALYRYDRRMRMLTSNEWQPRVAPRFWLGRTNEGHIWRFRADLPADLVHALDARCRQEPALCASVERPIHAATYIELLAAHETVTHVWAGPTYWCAAEVVPADAPVAIRAANANLLRGGMDAWLPDVPHRQPFLAIVRDGRAVSLCASARGTAIAHEAGVETLAAYRRQGHAVNAVAGWMQAVRARGALPLYSTSWENLGSRRVAAKLGLSRYGAEFHVT